MDQIPYRIFNAIGRRNAAVLPDPVFAMPITSLPQSMIGIALPQSPSRGQACKEWSIAGSELVPQEKYCPEAIEEYVKLGHSKASSTLLMDVRQHLSFLGWIIECKIFAPCPSSFRYRYTCPITSKVYYSLVLLCRDLRKSSLIRENGMPITFSRIEKSHSMNDAAMAIKSSTVERKELEKPPNSDLKKISFEAMYEKIVKSCNGKNHSSLLNDNKRRRVQTKEKSIVKYGETKSSLKRKERSKTKKVSNEEICSLCHYGEIENPCYKEHRIDLEMWQSYLFLLQGLVFKSKDYAESC